MGNGSAHAISVRIRCDHEIRLDLIAELQTELKCLAKLRIGIRACRKVPVRITLLRHYRNILNPNFLQNTGNAFEPCSIQGCIDDFKAVRSFKARDGDFLDHIDKTIEDLLRCPRYASLG